MKKYIKRVPEILGTTIPVYLFKEFRSLYIPYPFYCIDPIINLGKRRYIDRKKITFTSRDATYRRGYAEKHLFERAIRGMLLQLINYKEIPINKVRSGFESAGKLFNGGFKI